MGKLINGHMVKRSTTNNAKCRIEKPPNVGSKKLSNRWLRHKKEVEMSKIVELDDVIELIENYKGHELPEDLTCQLSKTLRDNIKTADAIHVEWLLGIAKNLESNGKHESAKDIRIAIDIWHGEMG